VISIEEIACGQVSNFHAGTCKKRSPLDISYGERSQSMLQTP
jgi:hypothetical protein